MFSSDLAYASRFDEDNWGSPPSYLTTNTRMISHPWKMLGDTDCLHSDFILIAEFSELEGPRPVLTIPKDGAGLFDVSEFAVRIMSVDQASAVSGGFHMTEDSQLILSENSKYVYAFVHHFVLFDKQARGYVRPFAISYVTNDQRKLLCCYEELSAHLRKVAKYFKYGNRMVFKNELDKYLMDLEFTKAQEMPLYRTVMSGVQSNSETYEKELLHNLKTLESMIAEIKSILNTVCATMNDKRLEQRFARLEGNFKVKSEQQKLKSDLASSVRDMEGRDIALSQISGLYGAGKDSESLMFFNAQSYRPKRIQIAGSRKFDLHLRGQHELCSWGCMDGIQKLKEMHKHFQQDLCVLELEKMETDYLDPMSGVLMFGTNFVACNFMSDIDKLCVGSCCSIQRSRPINRLLSRWASSDTLESYKSAASSFRSIPDMDDSASLGSVSSIEGSFSSYNTRDLRQDSESGLDSVPMSDTETTSFSSDFSIISSHKGDSFTSLDGTLSSSNKESVFAKLHSACNPNICAVDVEGSGARVDCPPQKTFCRSISQLESSTTTLVANPDCPTCKMMHRMESADQTLCECSCNRGTKVELSVEDLNLTEKSSGNNQIEHCNTHNEPNSNCGYKNGCLGDVDSLAFGCHGDMEKLSLHHQSSHQGYQERQDSTLTQQTDESVTENPAIVPLKFLPSLSTAKDSLSSSQGIYRLLNTYNNMQHVIYSLLSGRPVIVIATVALEKEVKDIVRALQHFLPNNPRSPGGANPNCCLTWLSHLPKITDLTRMRLVGVCRPDKKPMDRFITPAFKRFATIFDVERRLLLSPSYQGTFLMSLTAKKKSFKLESEILLMYIKGLLSEISSKAFIFFHLFCLGTAGTYASGYSLQTRSKSFQQTVAAFLSRLGALDSDAVIIQYMAEVIKHQHIENHYHSTDMPGVPIRPLLLVNNSCQTFKC